MHFSIRRLPQNYQRFQQIKRGVNFDRRFVLAKVGPRKSQKPQSVRSRLLSTTTRIHYYITYCLGGAKPADLRAEQHRRIIEEASVAGRISFGQGSARDPTAKAALKASLNRV
jgi:hypothetical protein